jgi:hypothetical protein
MPKTITINVPRKGYSQGRSSVKIETAGFKGQSCKTVSEAFEQCLGGETHNEELKAEFYETESGVEWLSEGGGDAPNG